MTTRTITAVVDLDHPDEVIEGQYFKHQSVPLSLTASDVRCPFCSDVMDVARAPMLGRIVREHGTRNGGRQVGAAVELIPDSHEALKCRGCDMILTRVIP